MCRLRLNSTIYFSCIFAYYHDQLFQVNFEARAVNANIVTRRCVLMSMGEISVDRMKELIENKAGSILIAIPEDPSTLTKGCNLNL